MLKKKEDTARQDNDDFNSLVLTKATSLSEGLGEEEKKALKIIHTPYLPIQGVKPKNYVQKESERTIALHRSARIKK